MDIIGLGKPRADSWLRKFRTRPSENLAVQGRFLKRHKIISWHHTTRRKNFGVHYGLTNGEDDIRPG
jgi:hypothetical protein